MQSDIRNLPLQGAALIQIQPFQDERGGFASFWEQDILVNHGIQFVPQSAHHSYNRGRFTMRALHFQKEPHAQAKLITCVSGAVWDVIVDLRPSSPTYRGWTGTELRAGDGQSVFAPRGFAHGFVTLVDDSTVAYLIEGEYAPDSSSVIRWNDPSIGIEWPITNPFLSERDRTAPFLDT